MLVAGLPSPHAVRSSSFLMFNTLKSLHVVSGELPNPPVSRSTPARGQVLDVRMHLVATCDMYFSQMSVVILNSWV